MWPWSARLNESPPDTDVTPLRNFSGFDPCGHDFTPTAHTATGCATRSLMPALPSWPDVFEPHATTELSWSTASAKNVPTPIAVTPCRYALGGEPERHDVTSTAHTATGTVWHSPLQSLPRVLPIPNEPCEPSPARPQAMSV